MEGSLSRVHNKTECPKIQGYTGGDRDEEHHSAF